MVPISFLDYFSNRFNVNIDELAYFLDINKRTLYNYRLLKANQLPLKIKKKFYMLFASYFDNSFDQIRMNDVFKKAESLSNTEVQKIMMTIRYKYHSKEVLDSEKMHNISYYRSKMDEYENNNTMIKESKKNKVGTKVFELNKSKNDFDLSKLEKLFKNVSKGYMESLVEVLGSKLEEGNDYTLLEYLSKYKKD